MQKGIWSKRFCLGYAYCILHVDVTLVAHHDGYQVRIGDDHFFKTRLGSSVVPVQAAVAQCEGKSPKAFPNLQVHKIDVRYAPVELAPRAYCDSWPRRGARNPSPITT